MPRTTLLRTMTVLGMCLLPSLVQAVQFPVSQGEIDEAMSTTSFKNADAALNAAYRQEISRVEDKKAKKALTEAQLAWLKFRDAEAMFGASGYRHVVTHTGGHWWVVYGATLTALTQTRARHLTHSTYEHVSVDVGEEPDKKLNNAYKRLRTVLDDWEKNLLTVSELAWIKFRDAECKRFSGPDHLSLRTVENVKRALTVERTRELTASYETYKKADQGIFYPPYPQN